jgi:hypothetical protein
MNYKCDVLSALQKPTVSRSYEDVLLIKAYISTLDLIKSKYTTTRSEQLDNLCRSINMECFQPRVCIFQKGDFADKMYVVFSGCCSLMENNPIENSDIDNENANEFFQGMSFGDDELQMDKRRPCFAFNESTTITVLLSVDRTSYSAFLADAYDANSNPTSRLHISAKDSLSYLMTIFQKPRHIRTAADIETMTAFLRKEMYAHVMLLIRLAKINY